MSYISKEQVAEKRAKLKAMFPAKDGWKFSVRNDDNSAIRVTIVAGPVLHKYGKIKIDGQDFIACPGKGFDPIIEEISEMSVNHHYANEDRFPKETCEILNKIIAVLNEGNHDNSDIQTDYFDVGWYISLNIGSWDKPYKVVA